MISGATEEELIVANARAEVLTKCGKDILDILDNQNEKYEKQLEHEVKYQNNEVVRLNNIINETRRILGEYKHYSVPDEQQNAKNEAIVDEAYNQLHSNLKELKDK